MTREMHACMLKVEFQGYGHYHPPSDRNPLQNRSYLSFTFIGIDNSTQNKFMPNLMYIKTQAEVLQPSELFGP